MAMIKITMYCKLVNTNVFTKYKGIDAVLVAIHHHQLSTFFLAISHIPVYAVALAKASAQGIAPSAKLFLAAVKAKKITT